MQLKHTAIYSKSRDSEMLVGLTSLFVLWPFHNCIIQFLPRDALQSAVLRLHVVCLSVTLVDQDRIRRKSWKLTARTIILAQHLRSS